MTASSLPHDEVAAIEEVVYDESFRALDEQATRQLRFLFRTLALASVCLAAELALWLWILAS
jgi:hypothetical protein